jgi:hypothetical protein
MCARLGSPSVIGLAVTSTRRSASVARSPSIVLDQHRTPGCSAIDLPAETNSSREARSIPPPS